MIGSAQFTVINPDRFTTLSIYDNSLREEEKKNNQVELRELYWSKKREFMKILNRLVVKVTGCNKTIRKDQQPNDKISFTSN